MRPARARNLPARPADSRERALPWSPSRGGGYSRERPPPDPPVRIADGASRMGAEILTTDPKPADLTGRYFYRASTKGSDGYDPLTAGDRNPSARRSRRDLEGD